MKHYLKGAEVWGFESDGSQDHLIQPEMTLLSDAELDALRAPTLEAVKAEARSELIAQRNASITSGVAYLGKTIDTDRDSVMAITGAAVAALAAKSAGLPYSVEWTCSDDSTLTLDADGVLGLAVSLAMFADAQHAKARPLKEAIKNAADVATLKTVKW